MRAERDFLWQVNHMKKTIAILLITLLTAALLCACGETKKVVEKTEDYPGTYVYTNNTLRENSRRVLTINEDGTYLYVRESSIEEYNGTYTGKWSVDEQGYIIMTGDLTGKKSQGYLTGDSLKLNVSDLENGDDTVGNGVYLYQFPEEE